MTDTCPHCDADLRGAPIPDRPGEFYSRTIMVEVQGVYDGGLYLLCPDCGGTWHRWPEGDWRHERAKAYVS